MKNLWKKTVEKKEVPAATTPPKSDEPAAQKPDAAPAPDASAPETPVIESILKPKHASSDDAKAAVDGQLPERPEDHFPEPPQNASDQVKMQWGEMKKANRALRYDLIAKDAQLGELRKKLETGVPGATSPEIEQLRAEHKAALDRLAILDIRSHPDYVRQYSEPKNALLNEAKQVISYNMKPDAAAPDVEGLLSKPQKEFNSVVAELTKDMNSVDAQQARDALIQAYRLNQKEQAVLAKPQELQRGLQSQALEKQKKAFEKVWSSAADGAGTLAELTVPKGATAEEAKEIQAYNQALGTVRSNAEKLAFSQMDEGGVATMASKAAALDFVFEHGIPRIEKRYAQAVATIANLEKELRSLRSATSPQAQGDPSNAPARGSRSTNGQPDFLSLARETVPGWGRGKAGGR